MPPLSDLFVDCSIPRNMTRIIGALQSIWRTFADITVEFLGHRVRQITRLPKSLVSCQVVPRHDLMMHNGRGLHAALRQSPLDALRVSDTAESSDGPSSVPPP